MGRKQRIKERDERRKERDLINFKKRRYHIMSQEGELGNKDLTTYTCMYENLSRIQKNDFKSPDEPPNREEYNKLKKFYYSHKSSSSLENIAYF